MALSSVQFCHALYGESARRYAGSLLVLDTLLADDHGKAVPDLWHSSSSFFEQSGAKVPQGMEAAFSALRDTAR